MKQSFDDDHIARDPVELLLGRIARRAIGGSLLAGAAVAGCTTSHAPSDPESEGTDGFTQPSSGETVGGETSDAGVSVGSVADATLPVDEPPARPPTRGDASTATPRLPTSDGGPRAEIPPGAYDPCARGPGFPVQAAGLALNTTYDYVAVRQSHASRGGPDPNESWTDTKFMLISEHGTACATATDGVCAAKVAYHPVPGVASMCVQACVEYSIVTTRGDAVERWATPDEVREVLGAVDSPDDALMAVASQGYNVSCPYPDSPLTAPAGANLRYVQETADGYELIATKYAETCPVVTRRFRLSVSASGELRELDSVDFPSEGLCIGRVPAGLASAARPTGEGGALGAHLAQCAHLEAASVYAFLRLAEELRAHGAPRELIDRAIAAADDEVRHADAIGALAGAHGERVEAPLVRALPLRTLEEIARENAVEGCVRETYGALVGAYQAERAEDEALRLAMRTIARDEARHAALSHAVHAWTLSRLAPAARARVAAAQREAIRALASEVEVPPRAELATAAGLPSSAVASAMVAELSRALWSAPRAA